jgi:hypothetical protein
VAKITVTSRDKHGNSFQNAFEATKPKAIANDGVLQIISSTQELEGAFPINQLESVIIEEFVAK